MTVKVSIISSGDALSYKASANGKAIDLGIEKLPQAKVLEKRELDSGETLIVSRTVNGRLYEEELSVEDGKVRVSEARRVEE